MTIKQADPGYYWAYYKDIGWFLIQVYVGVLGTKYAYEIRADTMDKLIIYKEEWFKYRDLRKVEQPA
jgi:hypothetical protein